MPILTLLILAMFMTSLRTKTFVSGWLCEWSKSGHV